MNKKEFFDLIRTNLFQGTLTLPQVQGMEAILDYYLPKYTNLEALAYVLATAYHESAHTMRAVREYGLGKGYDYGAQLDIDRKPYVSPKQLYYGRGLVQLTWRSNYIAAGKKLKIDLLNFPDLALRLDVAVQILVEGMVGGWFTGKKLADYFVGTKADAVRARRIINGNDKADLIAGYYFKFLQAISHAIS